MTHSEQRRRWIGGIDLWVTLAAYALALLMIAPATQLHAQTYRVLHTFTGGFDGAQPPYGLAMDSAGNL